MMDTSDLQLEINRLHAEICSALADQRIREKSPVPDDNSKCSLFHLYISLQSNLDEGTPVPLLILT